jgi:hypothetical protein
MDQREPGLIARSSGGAHSFGGRPLWKRQAGENPSIINFLSTSLGDD